MNRSADRPPVLRFLVLFAGLLAVALGLAAVSSDASQAPAERQAPSGAADQRAPSATPPR